MGDAYDVLGVPRAVAKAWATASLTNGRPLTRWSPRHRQEYVRKKDRDLSRDFPAAEVGALLTTKFPIFLRLEELGLDWGDLQYREGAAVIRAVTTLLEAGVPVLPVYDSLVVPHDKEAMAASTLTDHFTTTTGARPTLVAHLP